MRVILDNATCDQIQAETVAQAVEAAAVLARGRGRSIVDVIVDGDRWSAERIDSDEANAIGAACEVRFASADPSMLVCEAFADAADVLGEIDELQQSAASLMQSGQGVTAMDHLSRALELWCSVEQAISMGSSMARVSLEPQRPAIERLTTELRNVRGALERRDVLSLADILMYDLPDVVAEWRSILHELREHVRLQAKGGQSA